MVQYPYEGSFKVTSLQGDRVLNGGRETHKGIDLVGLESKNILAVKSGKVVQSRIVTDKTNQTWQWGNYVAIADNEGLIWYYCHLKERMVKVGQSVKAGDVIGVEGNTGYSFGSHLHLEVRKGSNSLMVEDYTGIKNKIDTYENKPDYAVLVKDKCGLEGQTVDYLNKYQYASDLWRKLWEAMK